MSGVNNLQYWSIDAEKMTLTDRSGTYKIRYDAENDLVYYWWEQGGAGGWDQCRFEIRDLYLKAQDALIDSMLLK
jgi:hypothetical protein